MVKCSVDAFYLADPLGFVKYIIALPPDSGVTKEECLNKLIEMLDGPGVFIVEDE